MMMLFWLSMAVIGGFLFEFGRKLDSRKYPDVCAGMLLVIIGWLELCRAVGKGLMQPPGALVVLLVGFALMAGHYLWSEFKAWRWPAPFVDRRKPTNTRIFAEDGDLTRTVRTLERKREAA